ncbi:MAG TPA: SDR family oxidoreductase [Mucilaginibacter sp.]|jgi:NAD(P)-dependent dehydrogenase (short-subunit alcohol dehydrogenase family)|nr:SDR family oxidoreductase [Mucilaginibacter sp.]
MYNNYFQNKIALVTGGGSGIGRAVCQRLAAAGAIVYSADIDLAKAEATAVGAKAGNIFAKQLDVTKKNEIQLILAEIVAQHGRIDLVFNNAGTGIIGECRDTSIYDWKYAFDLNFFGVLFGSQYAYELMLKQGSGQIVNTSSLAGLIDGLAVVGPYSTTKHAVAAYTRTLRAEARSLGIKVNLVCPGVVSTPITDGSFFIKGGEGYRQYSRDTLAKGIPPEQAARHILKGVSSNKAVIVFPFAAKVFLFISRISGLAVRLAMNKMLKDYRKKYREA